MSRLLARSESEQILSEAEFLTGVAHWNEGNREKAIRAMEKSLQYCPSNQNAIDALAMMQESENK